MFRVVQWYLGLRGWKNELVACSKVVESEPKASRLVLYI